MQERIVITGMGTINPLGLSVAESWQNVVKGVSGVGKITLFELPTMLVKIAAEVKGFIPENYMDTREARRRDRYEQLASVASQEAIRQSGIDVGKMDPWRVGVIISSAVGGIRTTEEGVFTLIAQGPRRVSPFVVTMLMSNGAAGMVSIDNGFQGPSQSVASACASGADGIGVAWMMLRAGLIDVAVAGAAEASISQIGIAALDRMGAMTRRSADVPPGPQPFDLNRDGLVMGEGSAVLVMETENHARRRGAEILAELAGYAATADAFHITAPAEDGSGAAKAMQMAMQRAGINPEDVGYINAHGTGTELNDLSETRAIKTTFGERAYQLPVSSTKSMTGHMMGATGALEAIFCVKVIHEGILPPTINYHTPDPCCDLDYVPNQAREKKVKVVLDNAFGFGGHNAVLVIKAYE